MCSHSSLGFIADSACVYIWLIIVSSCALTVFFFPNLEETRKKKLLKVTDTGVISNLNRGNTQALLLPPFIISSFPSLPLAASKSESERGARCHPALGQGLHLSPSKHVCSSPLFMHLRCCSSLIHRRESLPSAYTPATAGPFKGNINI